MQEIIRPENIKKKIKVWAHVHVRYLVMVQVRVSRYHDSFLNPHFWNSSFHRLRRKQKLDCHVIGNIFVNECCQA